GLAMKERRRLLKLGKTGEVIVNPDDAQKVRAYLEYLEWFNGTWGFKFIFAIGPILVILAFGIGLIVRAVRGDVSHALWDATILLGYSAMLFASKVRQRRYRLTAQVQCWATPAPPA